MGWATNVTGLRNVLEETLRSERGIRVVFTSSAAVYARGVPVPTPETASLHPRGVYGASKVAGEGMVAAAAAATRDGSAVVVRPFTVYGPGPASGARGHFIAHWIEQATTGAPLSLHYGGEQTVDLGYVDDVVRALQAAREGEPAARPVRHLQREQRDRDPRRGRREMDAGRPAGTPHFERPLASRVACQCADIGRARAELGFEPRTLPEAGRVPPAERRRMGAVAS